MEQLLIAYCNTQELPNITEDDVKRLNYIHISFGLVNESGEVYWDQKGTEGVLSKIRSINPDIKIVLSIGGWEADGFSQAAATKEGREKFTKTAVKIMQDNELDGLDIDWEYPCSSQAGIASSPEDKETFTLLIQELRKQIDACGKGQSLSIAAGALRSYINDTNMGEVQKYLDYVQLMTYDFYNIFSDTTGHHAGLYADSVHGEQMCADMAVKMFVEAGVPMEKIVMGAAFYGRSWIGISDGNQGLGEPVGDLTGKKFRHAYGYGDICKLLENGEGGFSYCWDDNAKAAYLYNGDCFITYEDKRALSHKVEYVRTHQMRGIMFWEYSEDQTRTLVEHLYHELRK